MSRLIHSSNRWDKVRGPSRRAFLGGAAAMLGLPWLESLAHAVPGSGPPLRLLFWYVPNGMRMERWTPATTGANYAMTELLAPLAAHRDKLLVLSNLGQLAGQDNLAGDHARGTASFLTARRATQPGQPVQLGVSVDYLASQAPCADTPFRSLQLATTNQPPSGECDSGYACAYQNSITWSGPDTPVPPRTDPRAAFAALFQGSDPLVSQAAQQRRHSRRESVLDYVLEESHQLETRLSSNDVAKLDQYMTGVRALETRLQNNPPNHGQAVCDPGTEPEVFLDYGEHLDQLIEIMVKAVECDATRVLSMMADASGSGRSFPQIGVPEAHHEMSHWATGTTLEQEHRLDQWQAICNWHVDRFGRLLTRLDATQDADGSTLLDNCMIYFSSEISDGNAHNHNNMPVLLAGGGGGRLDTGRHVQFANPAPIADLFLGMLDAFDAPEATFGIDGTGILPGIFLP